MKSKQLLEQENSRPLIKTQSIIMMFGAMQAGVASAAGGLALKSEALGDVRSSPWFQTPDQASSIG